jgi:hypothetical protein
MPAMLHSIMYMNPKAITEYILECTWNSVFRKELPRKIIHDSKLQVLGWFPVALTLIYKPIIDLLLI